MQQKSNKTYKRAPKTIKHALKNHLKKYTSRRANIVYFTLNLI